MPLMVWRISIHPLGLGNRNGQKDYSFLVAVKSESEKDAVTFARGQYTLDWWADNLLTGAEIVGELKAVEGTTILVEADL